MGGVELLHMLLPQLFLAVFFTNCLRRALRLGLDAGGFGVVGFLVLFFFEVIVFPLVRV